MSKTANELLEVNFVGQIMSGEGVAGDGGAHCTWKLVGGEGWKHRHGAIEGDSQSALPSEGVCVWQHPVDACFQCTMQQADDSWPHLEIEVRARDGYDRSDLAGYGLISLPRAPGIHQLNCHLWRPKGSLIDRISAYFIGGQPQLKSSKLLSGMDCQDERGQTVLTRRYAGQRLHTVSAGTVSISVAICVQRMETGTKAS